MMLAALLPFGIAAFANFGRLGRTGRLHQHLPGRQKETRATLLAVLFAWILALGWLLLEMVRMYKYLTLELGVIFYGCSAASLVMGVSQVKKHWRKLSSSNGASENANER